MKKLTYYIDKNDNQPFKIHNAEFMKKELDALPRGRYKMTIEKFHRKATNKQFSYLYGIVYPMMLQAAWENGYTTDDFKDVEELDMWAKARWASKCVTNRDTGEVIRIPITKSKFVTIDENLYCETLRTFVSEFWGVYIPDPNPNWRNNRATESD